MERVAFVLVDSGEQLRCLLNPETVVLRRKAGIQPRLSLGSAVTGIGLADDRFIQTGGGVTTLELDLLFDVNIAGSSINSEDVRDLTRPFWNLAENTPTAGSFGQIPLCRFIWGKSWNIPVLVAAVAERLEHFNPGGNPGRSWLRMRLLRSKEKSANSEGDFSEAMDIESFNYPSGPTVLNRSVIRHKVISGGADQQGDNSGTGERADQLAFRYLNDPGRWRELFTNSSIDDPLNLPAGVVLEIGQAIETGAN